MSIDVNFVWALVIVVCVIAFAVCMTMVVRNGLVKTGDLKLIQEIFKLTTGLVDEMNLTQEKQIMNISQIVVSSIDFGIVISNQDSDIKDAAYKQAISICEQFKIEMNDSRQQLVKQLIDIGLNALYVKDEETSQYIRRIEG